MYHDCATGMISHYRMDAFFKKFIEVLQPGMTVLDLGAGSGKYAQYLANHGMKVIAVDRRDHPSHEPNILWHCAEIQVWLTSIPTHEQYDAIFMRNILQFFDREFIERTLLPTLFVHLKRGGIIAIETFSLDPEPPFERPFHSYWTIETLGNLFPQWKTVFAGESSENRKDLRGINRKFHLTDLIVKNESEKG